MPFFVKKSLILGRADGKLSGESTVVEEVKKYGQEDQMGSGSGC